MRWSFAPVSALMLATALIAGSGPAKAEPLAQVWIDTAAATLGEPVLLSLRLTHDPAMRPAIPDLPVLLAQTDLEVIEGAPELFQGTRPDGSHGTDLWFRLRSFSLGEHQIPAMPVGFIRAAGDTLIRYTQPLSVHIAAVRDEGDESLRDIVPPRAIGGGIPLWLAGMLAALAVVAFVFVLIWLLQRRRSRPEPLAPPSAPIDYVAELRRISTLGHLERGEHKEYYSLLAETLRRFLEEVTGIEALEQTTSEISSNLRRAEEESTVREVITFLGVADLVKFARFVPELENARRAPDEAIGLVNTIQAARRKREELARQEQARIAREAAEGRARAQMPSVASGGRSVAPPSKGGD